MSSAILDLMLARLAVVVVVVVVVVVNVVVVDASLISSKTGQMPYRLHGARAILQSTFPMVR